MWFVYSLELHKMLEKKLMQKMFTGSEYSQAIQLCHYVSEHSQRHHVDNTDLNDS